MLNDGRVDPEFARQLRDAGRAVEGFGADMALAKKQIDSSRVAADRLYDSLGNISKATAGKPPLRADEFKTYFRSAESAFEARDRLQKAQKDDALARRTTRLDLARGVIDERTAAERQYNIRLSALRNKIKLNAVQQRIEAEKPKREQDDLRKQKLQAEGDYLKTRLQLLEEQGVAEDKATKRKGRSRKQEVQIIGISAAAAERIERQRLRDAQKAEADQIKILQARQKTALETIQTSENQRLAALQQSANAAGNPDSKAFQLRLSQEKLNIKKQELQRRLQQEQQYANSLDNQSATGPLAQAKLEQQRSAARVQASKTILQLVDLESDQIQIARQIEIEGIKSAAAEKKRQSDVAIAAVGAEAAAIDRVSRGYEIQGQLLKARLGLQSAISGLQQLETGVAIDGATRALAIRKELDSGQVRSLQERLALERELQQLGFASNATSPQILQQRIQLEAQLATQKRQDLLAQQAADRQALQIEIQRNDLAARRTQLEAQIALLKARQSVSDAQANLKVAQAAGDTEAIAQAQADVKLAQDSVKLAQDSVTAAKQESAAARELAAIQTQTLAINQQRALRELDVATAAKQTAANLELVRAQSEAIANAAEREAAARSKSAGAKGAVLPGRRHGGSVLAGNAYRVVEDGAEVFIPGVNGTILNQRQIQANLDLLVAGRLAGGGSVPVALRSPSVLGDSVVREIRKLGDRLSRMPRQSNITLQTLQPANDLSGLLAAMAQLSWR